MMIVIMIMTYLLQEYYIIDRTNSVKYTPSFKMKGMPGTEMWDANQVPRLPILSIVYKPRIPKENPSRLRTSKRGLFELRNQQLVVNSKPNLRPCLIASTMRADIYSEVIGGSTIKHLDCIYFFISFISHNSAYIQYNPAININSSINDHTSG